MHYEVDPPNTTLGNDMRELLARGDVNGSSFAFTVDDDGQEWQERDDGTTLRTIKKVSGLYDVSLVTVGAYEDASVAIRSLDELKKSEVAKSQSCQQTLVLHYAELLLPQRLHWHLQRNKNVRVTKPKGGIP